MKEREIINNINNKLGISILNDMQKNVLENYASHNDDIIILSPTGSGKTLAYAIPLLKSIKISSNSLQAIVIAPSRELVIQISNIIREISTNIKVSTCYGGHNVLDEKQSLSVIPDIIICTPGRLLDHINRKNIDVYSTKFLVLDEFDKSLELGFHEEMEKILKRMPNLSRKILTSATTIREYPDFLKLNNAKELNYLIENEELRTRLQILNTKSPSKDKLETLLNSLENIDANSPCIVFVNYRESVDRVFDYLHSNNIPVGIYHGGMDQIEREKAIEMFNNGSFKVLVTTDLGARGLDIADVGHIYHYHLPVKEAVFTHRNGRSARIAANGIIHVITSPDEKVPEYIIFDDVEQLSPNCKRNLKAEMTTLYVQAGKKEKISKGDIVGFLINKGNLSQEDIGIINSHDHYTLVAVNKTKIASLLKNIESQKIKNKKIRISIAQQRN